MMGDGAIAALRAGSVGTFTIPADVIEGRDLQQLSAALHTIQAEATRLGYVLEVRKKSGSVVDPFTGTVTIRWRPVLRGRR